MSCCKQLLLLIFASILVYSHGIQPGPAVKSTKGEVWPKPQIQQKNDDYFVVLPRIFRFNTSFHNIGCPAFLSESLDRYWKIISRSGSLEHRGRFFESPSPANFWTDDENFISVLNVLNVELTGKCEENVLPDVDMIENYTLTVTRDEQKLEASSIWGILRGLETFSQLIYFDNVLILNATSIEDFPRFKHRGLLLDTSRHFLPLYSIFHTLEAMSYNKLNVFHWHIVDDQSFPYKSKTFPELSEQGSYHPISKVYEQRDIQKVIEYARIRGIRVIPEFDTPGHTRSWGVSHPELLTECYDSHGKKNGLYGPLNPINPNVYIFVEKLLREVVSVFHDQYFHMGGDEVDFLCWKSNPDIVKYMKLKNITNYVQLEGVYVQEVVKILNKLGSKYVVWEEVFLNGADIPNSTVVHVWRPTGPLTLHKVTAAGKLALYSSCWYLDHLFNGGDWLKYYQCDPQDFVGTEEQKKLVIGGEACMWGESVNEYNLVSRIWPRASAAAEKLWSSKEVVDVEDAAKRLEEHTCRMNFRGIGAEPPNGPGVCL